VSGPSEWRDLKKSRRVSALSIAEDASLSKTTYRERRMQLGALLFAYFHLRKYDTIWAFCKCILTIISWGREGGHLEIS
jgi:hypothetical protein